jgi:hypothetical protein
MEDAITDLRQFSKRILVGSYSGTIAASGKLTGRIETSKTLHAICFVGRKAGPAGQTAANWDTDVGLITIKANGITIREATAKQFLDLYKHYNDDMGAFTVEGVLPITFAQSAFDLAQLNNAYGFGMLQNGKPITLTFEIQLKAGLTTLTSLEVRAIVDDREQELGLHTRLLTHTRSFASTGYQDLTDMPKGDGTSSLLAYHFVLGNGVISKFIVKEGAVDRYNTLDRELLEWWLNTIGRKVQSGYCHLPFNTDNDPRSKQYLGPTTDNWLVQPYWSTTPNGAYTILEEREHSKL